MKNPLWERLPTELQSRVDELIANGDKVAAIVAIRDAPGEPRPGIAECMALLGRRCAELGEPWVRPSPPPDLDALTKQVAALPHRPDAIEALWDGDTDGWFVCLVAVTLRPKVEHSLAMSRRGGDMRIFKGQYHSPAKGCRCFTVIKAAGIYAQLVAARVGEHGAG